MMGPSEMNDPPPIPVNALLINSLFISDLSAVPPMSIRTTYVCIFFEAPDTAEKIPIKQTAMYASGLRPTTSDRRPMMGAMMVCASM